LLHDYHVEFDDITHEFDPEMIERWSMKDDKELKAWCEAIPVVYNCGCEACQIKADELV